MNDTTAALRAAASDVMAIDDVTEGVASPYVVFLGSPPPRPDERGQAVRLRGRLLFPPDETCERLDQRYGLLGFTPLLCQEEDSPAKAVILALPMPPLYPASAPASIAGRHAHLEFKPLVDASNS